MGEDGLKFVNGRVCYYDETDNTLKPLPTVSKNSLIFETLPYVEGAEPNFTTTPGDLEGTMTIAGGSELYWIITHGYEKLRLYNYLDICCGTDRRRIKRHKRRIRMFKIKQKIAESRGQIQK